MTFISFLNKMTIKFHKACLPATISAPISATKSTTISGQTVSSVASIASNHWSRLGGGVGGDHRGGADLGVGGHHLGVGCHLSGGLGALGGDGLLAVLDGGDVGDSLADRPAHLPGCGDWDFATFPHRDGLTHGSSSSHGSNSSVARVSLRVSFRLSLGLSLTVASHRHRSGSHTASNHFAVVTHHGAGVLGLGGGLVAGSGDDLLAVLGDGGVQDLVVLLVTLLPRCLHLAGVAGGDGDAVTDGRRHRALRIPVAGLRFGVGLGLSSDQESLGGPGTEEDGEELHVGLETGSLPT